MPAIQLERKALAIREYVSRAGQRPDLSEYARGVAFVQLLKDVLLEAEPQFLQDYLAGMERPLGGPKTGLYQRGRPDALYGNLVIEFKRSLAKSLDEARGQLGRYLSILLSEPADRDRPLIAVATDGIQFEVFAPRFDTQAPELRPEDIRLVPIKSADLASMDSEEVYYWLDRWFTRQTGRLRPRTKLIVDDFGPASGAYIHSTNLLDALWKSVESDSESQVFFESWQKYLRITYGGPVADRELFLRHTYLATLAKIMVWIRLTERTEPPEESDLRKTLNGQYFSDRLGIQNFLEEDFFAWTARDAAWPHAKILTRRLLLQLGTYNLRELSEDVLKGLYERLVDPKDRHDLGEFYTPDWLAASMVRECLQDTPNASVLDPACGSGTFLYQTIHLKREKLGNSAKTLKHICENVVGIEIHPLAVIVAKTTYLLGLGDLLEKRPKAVRIPIYLADSIKLPEERLHRRKPGPQAKIEFPSPPYVVPLDGQEADFPEDLALSGDLYDRAIELCSQYARSTKDDPLSTEEEVVNFLKRHEPALLRNDFWRWSLYELFKVLREKIQDRKDTIWAFILKNVFKPLLLKGHFDLVIGNPPWLTYNRVEKGEYQAFLKKEITREYELLTGRPELLTHMELGTLFFVRCADLYVKNGGRIAFVLPKSVFVADQHHALRSGSQKGSLRLMRLWDLEGVRPLFNVPASVAFGEKTAQPVKWPLPGAKFSGELPVRNASLEEAEKDLRREQKQFWLSIKGRRSYFSEKKEKPVLEGSPYAKKFAEGATIVPRSFWFVEVQRTPGLGADPTRPYMKTDPRAIKIAKDKYKGVCVEGNVEADFLYPALLAGDLVPFGHLPFRAVVLPVRRKGDGYEMLTATQARREGYLGLAEWLEKCDAIWKEKRGDKGERETIYSWLDYRKKLTQQRRKRFTVVYPMANRIMLASVIQVLEDSTGGNQVAQPFPFIDYKLFYFDTDSHAEAHFIASFLNSKRFDSFLQVFRGRMQGRNPDVTKKVWEFPVPQFDDSDTKHQQLADLGEACQARVEILLPTLPSGVLMGALGRLRNVVRRHLDEELSRIDSVVNSLTKDW